MELLNEYAQIMGKLDALSSRLDAVLIKVGAQMEQAATNEQRPDLRDCGMLRQRDAAKYMGISVAWLYRLTMRKEIPVFKVGNRNYFKPSDLDEYVQRVRVASVTDAQRVAEVRELSNTNKRGGQKNV